ncbi:N-formylglutamate amidohydrolase [Aquibium sp. ELW1220]|uniref:N-formylglutamate amidohydrolase n=1 Tax=Aquibium sp. ELW1220 TaxID=2976766 RepID=UPI0025AFB470|nr:N-formylglutamate amidohydrolase [Aquibium sp. ELW1220]MDN2580468.1 N-formylglutamate amidohydrolase [Aquibium sp. ELW1220]
MISGLATGEAETGPVRVFNRDAAGPFVLVCDHASNRIPEDYGTLGLPESELTRHIAWDPGAAPVSRRMAERLDAVLVESAISRLIVDCNRPLEAPDLMPALSETTAILGNQAVPAEERARRIALAHVPFHDAIETIVTDRLAAGRPTMLVSVHSFTPVYRGVSRPWHVGIIHDEDERLSAPMIAALSVIDGVVVGNNEPYAPADRVYYTLERHARSRELPCAMIEIRNDEICDPAGQALWADRLATILSGIQEPGVTEGEAKATREKGIILRA